jgi:protein-tyrosine phosphatase
MTGVEDTMSFHVLAVCIGNVCRSPLMEELLRRRLPDGVTVSSAGVRAMVGDPMDTHAAAELARLGGNADGLRARQFQSRMAAEAQLVLTATSEVRSRVLEEAPAALKRSFTVLEFAYLARAAPPGMTDWSELVAWAATNRSLALGQELDVVDPMGRSPEVHREAADAIDQATAELAGVLRLSGPSRGPLDES